MAHSESMYTKEQEIKNKLVNVEANLKQAQKHVLDLLSDDAHDA